jgi:hypothetical protein
MLGFVTNFIRARENQRGFDQSGRDQEGSEAAGHVTYARAFVSLNQITKRLHFFRRSLEFIPLFSRSVRSWLFRNNVSIFYFVMIY